MILENRVKKVNKLAKSFKNAYKGVLLCIKNERNMRIHLTIAAYVLAFSPFYKLNSSQYIMLLIVIGMVLFAESVNTAIEFAVNLHTPYYDNLARISKDVAAGAVLICAFFAAIIGCIFFLKPDIIIHIVKYMFDYPVWGCLFLISLPIFDLFIFCWPIKVNFKNDKNFIESCRKRHTEVKK